MCCHTHTTPASGEIQTQSVYSVLHPRKSNFELSPRGRPITKGLSEPEQCELVSQIPGAGADSNGTDALFFVFLMRSDH